MISSNKVIHVPQIMQMEATECGAACLTMILAYYGKWVPLEKVREICGVNRDGVNANNILKAARSFGLDARGRSMRISAISEKKPFPCMVFWEYSHFIVLKGFKGDKVFINDPAGGELKITVDEFKQKYSGVVLTFEKTEAFEKGGTKPDVMGYVIRRLRGLRSSFLFIMLTTAVSSLSIIMNTSLRRVFLDGVLTAGKKDWLLSITIAMLLLAFVTAVSSVLNAVYSLKIQGKSAMVSSAGFFRHLLYLPVSFFAQRSIGDLQLRQSENETITFTLLGQFAPLVINFVMLILYLIFMLRYSPVLTVVGVLTVLINAMVSKYISQKRINVARAMMADSGKFYGATVSGIEMIETIKASGAEEDFLESWGGYQAKVNTGDVRMREIDTYLGMLPEALTGVANILVVIMGIRLIIAGEMTPGTLLAFTGFLTAFLSPVMEIVHLGQTIQESQTQMERLEDVMRYPADTKESDDHEEENRYTAGKLSGRVDIDHLTFGYSVLEDPLIEDFSLHIEPGRWVALVGKSGCGKSTIGRLITGLYKPWSGEITYDGIPLSEIPNRVFRSSTAVVDQEIVTFSDTVADNVRLWDQSIENFEVILACRDAEIHKDISERTEGYGSMIYPGGKNFSGGQLQRLEIARALAQDPRVLILDEATSALDAKTEEGILQHIRDRGITCIIAAHRLSTVRNCDEIIVLDRGRVIERGTHEELMNKGGEYLNLIRNE